MQFKWAALAGISLLLQLGCGSDGASDGSASDVADQTASATVRLTADFATEVRGVVTAGRPLRVEYALERLPQCRGQLNGGPGWTVTGYVSENGAPAKTFEVSRVEGSERVAAPATLTPSEGGDLALWFQVTNRWGCTEFDSDYGQNLHFQVAGPEPETDATIVFDASGAPKVEGALRAGGRARVRYAQTRLTTCERTQMGRPVWSVTGFAKVGSDDAISFDTGRVEGSERVSIDAVVALPKSGELALWFQTTSIGGCVDYDSNGGGNYRFPIE